MKHSHIIGISLTVLVVVVILITSVLAVQMKSSDSVLTTNKGIPFTVIYKWKQLDFNFPSSTQRTEMIESGEFIPGNNILIGMKVHSTTNRIFIGVPRI